LDGLIVVDKPPDIMSMQLVSLAKSFLKADKAGHAGTLDPFATGVMVCLINRATRLAEFFLHGDKAYSATLCLGIETDTQDFTGTVIRERPIRPEDYSLADIISVFQSFEGRSRQVPSCFSALKHRGKPLYQYARKGVRVEKPARPITVFSLKVEKIDLPSVHFHVRCSGGTYIRTLCQDIGEKLGCGAHLTALCRTEACGFTLNDSIALDALKEMAVAGKAADRLISMNDALHQMPAYVADDNLSEHVRHGRQLTENVFPDEPDVDKMGYCKLVDKNGHLLAVIHKQEEAFRYYCVFPESAG